MMAPPWRSALLLSVGGFLSAAAAAPRSARPIRGIEGLARAYDFSLEARFDQVDAELRRACGPAPPEACDVLGATALWWRILLDPESRALDDEFSTAVDRAIESTEAWTDRAPEDAEAWFYNGGAYTRPAPCSCCSRCPSATPPIRSSSRRSQTSRTCISTT